MAGSANRPSRCFRTSASSLFAVAMATSCLTACDPNVVIGAKRSVAPGSADPVPTSGGSGRNVAGASGQGGTALPQGPGGAGAAGAAGTLLFEAHHETDLSEW